MKKPTHAILKAFGATLDKLYEINDLTQNIFLAHYPPLKIELEREYDISEFPKPQKARFEFIGKWDKQNEFPIFEFIGLE